MTAKNGLPCVRCGTSEWYERGGCKVCTRNHTARWKENNPSRNAANKRRWKENNQDKNAEYYRRWAQANRDKLALCQRRWREANPEKNAAKERRRHARKTQAGGSFTADEFKALCEHYGNRCVMCGRDGVKLTFDHVIPVSKGGTSDISNGQPLCQSCNSAKKDKYIDYRPDAGLLRWTQPALLIIQHG